MSGYYNVLMSNHVLSVVGPSVVETENSSIGESPGKMPFEDKRSNWSYAESPDIPAYVYRWTSAYMALVGCFGIASNLLVIVGFLRKKEVSVARKLRHGDDTHNHIPITFNSIDSTCSILFISAENVRFSANDFESSYAWLRVQV